MRLLFSATPAYGHILPLAPLITAAADAGHAAALVTSAGFETEARAELAPEVDFLAGGVMPAEFSGEAARRTGADVFHPTPALIGEIFGGARVDLGAAESLAKAREWVPDLVVCEAFDAIGPMIAAELGVPWYQVGVGPGVVAAIGDAIERTAVSRYSDAGLAWVDAATYLDPCPPLLQDPQWSSRVPVLPVRAQAHRRPRDTAFERPVFADPTKPTVLVTLGTIFSDPDTLAATVRAAASHDVNVIATLGSSMRHTAAPTDDRATAGVAYVPFVPLGQLLDSADLLVGSGGSGTVLAALAHGLPMVLWPQGADQPINAARAADAGTSITVDDAAGVSAAVARVLAEDDFRRRALAAASEIADRPSPTDVVKEITSR